MRRYAKGEQIGTGAHKDVFDAAENPKRVVAEYKKNETLSDDQIKNAYYLQKIAHIFFPKNIPDIEAAFNYPANPNDLNPDTNKKTKTGPSSLYIEKGFRDEGHDLINKHFVKLFRNGFRQGFPATSEHQSAKMLIRLNEDDPDVIDLIKFAKERGIILDRGGQNFSRDPEAKHCVPRNEPRMDH